MGRGFARKAARKFSAGNRAATFRPARFGEGRRKAGQRTAADPEIPARQPARSREDRQEPAALAFRGARLAHERKAAEGLERDPLERVRSRARAERHGETPRKKATHGTRNRRGKNLVDTEMIEKSAPTRHEDRCRGRGKPAIEKVSRARDEGRRRDRTPQGISSRAAARSRENEPSPTGPGELTAATRPSANLEIDPAAADGGPTAWRDRARGAIESVRGRADADQAARRGRARRARAPEESALAKLRDARGTALAGLGSRATAHAMLACPSARREDRRRGDSERMEPLGPAMPWLEVECLEPAMRWRSPPRRGSRLPETGKRRKSTGTWQRGLLTRPPCGQANPRPGQISPF